MTPVPYDFRNPAPLTGDLGRRLDLWFAEAVRRAGKSWGKVLNSPPQWLLKSKEIVPYEDCLAYFGGESLCFRVALGLGDTVSLVALPRPLMLVLIGSALGETVASLPVDRELTSVEESLCEYLVRVLMLDQFQDAWSGARPLTLHMQQREIDPRANLPFIPGEGVLVCTFSVVGPFGTIDWCWLLPRSDWLEDLVGSAVRPGTDAATKPAEPQMEALARLMPVELVVLLGNTELALTQVEQLRAGDLILLDQEVNQPLQALVSGAAKFQVFPGAQGGRQAVRIESVVAG